jgi:hypothetical protein
MDEDKLIEKTIEEGTKQTVGKLVDGISSFFSSICMPAAEEFGLYLRDRVAIYRLTNLYKVILKSKKKIESRSKEIDHNISPKLIKCIVDEASWADDEIVQEMWAGLLSGAILSHEKKDESVIYTNQLKDLSVYEARLVDLIYSDYRIGSVQEPVTISHNFLYLQNDIEFHLTTIFELSPTPLDHIVEGRSHKDIISNEEDWGIALGFIKPQINSLIRHGLIEDWGGTAKNSILFNPNSTGLDLYMRCTGYKIYPLEAYLLTRRHWAVSCNIDPFTWRPNNLNNPTNG